MEFSKKLWDWFLWKLPLYSDDISLHGVLRRRSWHEWRELRQRQRDLKKTQAWIRKGVKK
jgi:hypothetical protein